MKEILFWAIRASTIGVLCLILILLLFSGCGSPTLLCNINESQLDPNTGVFRWTPNSACAGKTYYFTVVASDPQDACDVKTVGIKVEKKGK